ncbi:type 2 lanthipeptide synthetase LanM family protein [Halorussus salilacus]|uniref:type 2 lanthipeptide synthetase LanM family protein n=1 Tax=Halorussus salilacus TaxID=2953750 RepID=UPI0020A0AF23|nr:type 2 lanthipeptide synthetase LanM family protein [Halorussus salilacus]USZ69218.1 type 2 lanthipeptide synthetase LanM family protein [Halorussus salilacus]
MRQSLLSESAARTTPLDSYLDSEANPPLPSAFDFEEFLADWRDVFDSEGAFAERLALSGYTVEGLRERFEALQRGDSDVVPSALETAGEVVARAVELERPRPLASRYETSPFVDLVAPLADAGTAGTDLESEFSSVALDSLTDWLFERLTTAFQHPLFILFKAYQRREYPDADFEETTDSTTVYDEFVRRYGDYDAIFETYPVLFELLGRIVEQWHTAVSRLDERLAADGGVLAEQFNDGEELGRVADVAALSDDPHGDGEIVWRIDFEADCSVVYKPRSVGGEQAFADVLDWTNEHTDVPDLYAPRVLDRDDYGWMEVVTHAECDSAEGVERYFERMGALSALAFVLGSTDLHQENIVAAGDQPIIVDHETVLSPRFDAPISPSSPALSSLVERSILETVLVPFTTAVTEGDSQTVTNSGLTKLDDVEYERKSPAFSDPNTDGMEMSFRDERRLDGTNLPRLDGEIRGTSEYVDELKRGFRDAVDAISADREGFRDGPLRSFEGCEIRYLVRPTGHYSSKLIESAYSSQLRSGIQRSFALESLYRIFLPESEDGLINCVEAEKATLRRFAIPRFTVDATGHELRDGHGEPQGAFVDQSPLDHACERVEDLDEHWIETQLRLLDLAFTSSTVPDPVAAPSENGPSSGASVSDADATPEVVSNVVAHLENVTTEYPDGSDRWAELARSSPDDAFLLQEPQLNLYEGYAGVGVFLAAAAAVRDDDRLAARSRRVLQPIQTAFEDGNADHLRIGGATGKGSVAYGLVTAGELLDDSELLEAGRSVAGRTTREEIESDTELDVVGGTAGELLAQLAVHERTGDGGALERARWCGDHLLEATAETGDGYRIPTSEGNDPRFAFAHGAGGIGAALVKLSAATGEETYARVGENALRCDAERWRRETDPECENLYDDESGTIWGWCNGAVGVTLGHVVVAETAGREVPTDISIPRENLRTEPSLEDSLCCGSMGRALVMVDAGETLGDPELTSKGETLFEKTLERAEAEGRFRIGNHLPMLPRFGLFTGLAGVGYVALQLTVRDRDIALPNVMRLE